MNRRKLSVQIGINYTGKSYQLDGCVVDVHNIKDYLIKHQGYELKNMIILTDESSIPIHRKPTKSNILQVFQSLIHLINVSNDPCDVFIQFSGHGTNIPDKDSDEKDHKSLEHSIRLLSLVEYI